jgi:hypothetical protein
MRESPRRYTKVPKAALAVVSNGFDKVMIQVIG